MKIGVLGAGRIGGRIARRLVDAGHEVALSFGRDGASQQRLVAALTQATSVLSPADAVSFGSIVVISAPWSI